LDSLLEYFDSQKDSDRLRLLIVVEEAHLRTLKEVGKDAVKFLDKAARSLRKKKGWSDAYLSQGQRLRSS